MVNVQNWMNDVLNRYIGTQELIENARIAESLNGRPRYAYHFDGNTLSEYDRLRKTREWGAMSGRKDYQNSRFQSVRDKGPLPEGQYTFNRRDFQRYEDLGTFDKLISSLPLGPIKIGPWPNGTYAWGNHRVDLHPNPKNEMYGRTGLTMHGGGDFGSGGCIDLEKGMDDFYRRVSTHMQDVFPLTVRYDENSFK